MTKKTSSEYEYDGLGFPITLLNFPLIEVRGVTVPDVDYNLLQKNVLLALCRKPTPLTGNEIRFIRQYLQMTYSEFAKRFGVTHPIVIHWEKSKNDFAKIQPSTEFYIRLCILDTTLKAKNKVFRETFRNFNCTNFKTQKNKEADQNIIIDLKTFSTN